MPPSVCTRSVTIGRLPFGFSAAPASGSSAGSSTRWVRVAVIFMASPQGGRVEKRSAGMLGNSQPTCKTRRWAPASTRFDRNASPEEFYRQQERGEDGEHGAATDCQSPLEVS